MNPLAFLSLTTFGPALLLGAVQGGGAMPEWSRWVMGLTGVAAMGLAAHELCRPAPDSVLLVMGLQRELQTTSEPAAALRLAIDHLRADPHYYTRGVG